MLNRQLNDLLDFSDLLVKTANHIKSAVWHLFYLHQTNKWINHAWQNFNQLVTHPLKSDTCVWNQVFDIDLFVNFDNLLAVISDFYKAFVLAHHF